MAETDRGRDKGSSIRDKQGQRQIGTVTDRGRESSDSDRDKH